nr:MAG TPA: hypothetical protein [Caudoviricetes sp.]
MDFFIDFFSIHIIIDKNESPIFGYFFTIVLTHIIFFGRVVYFPISEVFFTIQFETDIILCHKYIIKLFRKDMYLVLAMQ